MTHTGPVKVNRASLRAVSRRPLAALTLAVVIGATAAMLDRPKPPAPAMARTQVWSGPLSVATLRPGLDPSEDGAQVAVQAEIEVPPDLRLRRIDVVALGETGDFISPMPAPGLWRGPATETSAPAPGFTPFRVAQALDTPSTPDLALRAATLQAGNRLSVSGTSRAAAAIRLFVDSEYVATVLSGLDGRWSAVSDGRIMPGTRLLRIDEVDRATAQVSRSAEQRFDLTAVAGTAPASSGPRDPSRLGDQTETAIVNGGVTPNLTTQARPAVRDPEGFRPEAAPEAWTLPQLDRPRLPDNMPVLRRKF